jgi:predicted MPP superfamily phosphohydrolase
MKLITILLFLQVALIYGTKSQFSVAFLSDTHIGDSQGDWGLTKTARAVDAINANIQKYNISIVFHTGDVTDKADPKSFEDVYSVLKRLQVKWFPLIGKYNK